MALRDPISDPTLTATPMALWRLSLLWGLVVLAAFVAIAVYAKTPGREELPPPRWGQFLPKLLDGHWRLVMAIHPQCPCSRASLVNLQRVLERHAATVTVDLYVYRPTDTELAWSDTPLVRLASQMPTLSLHDDIESRKARAFGIRTSGGVVLYSPEGEVVFYGGVTPSRGHEGACAGLSAIEDAIDGKPTTIDRFPVFGCPLLNDGAMP